MNLLEDIMAYRFESSAVYELEIPSHPQTSYSPAPNRNMKEITRAIWEFGQRADHYAKNASVCSARAYEAALKAKQVFSK
jgi:hypothetical protein